MKNNKDILFLLEEVQTMAQTLCSEKAGLEDQVKKVEDELSPLRAAKTELTETVQTLQASNAQMTKELPETKTQLTQALQAKTQLTQKVQTLQASNAQMTKELPETLVFGLAQPLVTGNDLRACSSCKTSATNASKQDTDVTSITLLVKGMMKSKSGAT